MKFQQRTVLITGGTSGMGLEWARELLRRGNTIIVTGRDQHKLESIKRSLPDVHTFRSDAGESSGHRLATRGSAGALPRARLP